MRFLTGYYCYANCHSSLVLQQVTRRKGKVPVVFAFVWENEDCGEMVKRDVAQDMTEWFYEKVLSACACGSEGACLDTVVRAFEQEAEGVRGTFAVFFAVGRECFYAWRGGVEIHLLNRSFNRGNRKRLTYQTEEFCMERGRLEEGVGVLLGSARFFEQLPEQLIKECLAVEGLENSERVERHLREVSEAARQRGAEELVMILVVAREG